MTNQKRIEVFRAKDAPGLMEAGAMEMKPMSDIQKDGLRRLVDAGYLAGDRVKILADVPGFNIAWAWLKKDYPLQLHSHNSDCMYLIVAGSLKMGTEELGPRDCFFVPAGAAYSYVPGPEGVEVVEFRQEGHFDFVNLTRNAAFFEKAARTISENAEHWKTANPPSGVPF